MLKHAVQYANSGYESSVEKDELDVTLRACGLRSAARHRMKNNKRRRTPVTAEGSTTTDTTASSLSSTNDVLEEWPSGSPRSKSIDNNDGKHNDTTGHIRRNSLDFECVNESLRTLNMTISNGADVDNARTNGRKHEMALKSSDKQLSSNGAVSADKLGNGFHLNESSARLLSNVLETLK